MATININTDQKFDGPFVLDIRNARGEPAAVDGVPVWASSDDTVLKVIPAADGMSAQVDLGAPSPNAARLTVTADADLGAGVSTITGVSDDFLLSIGPKTQASVMTLKAPAVVEVP